MRKGKGKERKGQDGEDGPPLSLREREGEKGRVLLVP